MPDIASTRGEIAFAALQPDIDTFTMPTSSGTIPVTSSPEFTQKPEVAENEEMVDTYSAQQGKFAGYKAGTWKLSTNFKLSGTPGILSNLHPLLLSLYGRHTVNAGTDIRYRHYRKNTDDLVFLSIIVKRDFVTEYITGAVVNQGEMNLVATKIQGIDFSGQFKKKVRSGTCSLLSGIDGTVTPVTVLPLKEAEAFKRFDIDSYIYVGTDDNSGTGHKVVDIDPAANTVTIENGVTTLQGADSVIAGFVPVVSLCSEDISTRYGWINIDTGAAGQRKIAITEANYSIDNGIKSLDDIVSDQDFNTEVVPDTRKVLMKITKYFDIKSPNTGYDIRQQTDCDVELNIGKETGKSIRVLIPKMRILDTGESGTPQKKKNIDGQCFPDTGDDESTLILK
jgi:hypothetical protein